MSEQYAITPSQQDVLERLTCERFSCSPSNAQSMDGFTNAKNSSLVAYAIGRGFDEDVRGILAFYIVKTSTGLPLLFFSIKCGQLFHPFNETVLQETVQQWEKVRDALKIASNSSNDSDIDRAVDRLKQMCVTYEVSVEFLLNNLKKFQSVAQEKKSSLSDLERDVKDELNKNVARVRVTFPGVEIVHFCANDAARPWWGAQGFERPMGEVLFWKFVKPIFPSIQQIAGCEYAYLFAADASLDRSLVNYYRLALGFIQDESKGVNKPRYDLTCAFMSQSIVDMERREKAYWLHFNDSEYLGGCG